MKHPRSGLRLNFFASSASRLLITNYRLKDTICTVSDVTVDNEVFAIRIKFEWKFAKSFVPFVIEGEQISRERTDQRKEI